MLKVKKNLKRIEKDLDEMCEYLGLFNSVLAPRGEGARQCACQEFHELMEHLHNELIKLEEKTLNEFDWSIEMIEMID